MPERGQTVSATPSYNTSQPSGLRATNHVAQVWGLAQRPVGGFLGMGRSC